MTIRDFEIFIAVAETGQMGVASRKLYITQPRSAMPLCR